MNRYYLLIPIVCGPLMAGTPGSISGSVVDGDARPARAAGVTLLRLSTGKTPFRLNATTNPQGTFSFRNVPPGPYRVCAQLPNTLHLNPCNWNRQTPTLILESGQTLQNVRIPLLKGAAIPIRVEDADDLVGKNERITRKAHLLVAAMGGRGGIHTARLASRDARGRNYEIVVPFDTPVTVVVRSRFFKLADEADRDLPRGTAPVPYRIQPADAARVARLTVRVKGTNPVP